MPRLMRAFSLVAAALLPSICTADLRDRALAPESNLLAWPRWYRDTNNLALGLCKSQVQSPNVGPPAAGGDPATICTPIVPEPTAFPGNVGPELFYNSLTIKLEAPGISVLFIAALEAAYGLGIPSTGTTDEIVFSRIRIRADITEPGTYTITHPFGTEVFTNVPVGRRTINFTRDLGIRGVRFDAALTGDIGPFIQWINNAGTGRTNPGERLSVFDPTVGATLNFVGDPNVLHAFTGSPTGFNLLRVLWPSGKVDEQRLGAVEGVIIDVVGPNTAPPTAAPILRPQRLRDRSLLPVSATLGWPQWYRDNNGLLLTLCTSRAPSSNGPGFFCIPTDTDPTAFAGNIGPEAFYFLITIDAEIPGVVSVQFTAALEAAYANGIPTPGDEIVFSRIRVRADVTVPGTYIIRHPYGTEVFTDVPAGRRTINLTRDIGAAGVPFDGALRGDVGPFILGTPGPLGLVAPVRRKRRFLQFTDPATATTTSFIGDPNVGTSFTGSPTGFNKLRIEAPTGAFVEQTQARIQGQIGTEAPGGVPSPPANPTTPTGLLLWYKFDDPAASTTIRDYSGNGRIGVVKSDASGTATGALTGSFLSLDGSQKQFVDITNTNAAWGALNDWSVTMSINFGAPTTFARIFEFSNKPRTLNLDNNGNLAPAGGFINGAIGGTSAAINVWLSVAPGTDRTTFKYCDLAGGYAVNDPLPANTWVALTWTYEAAHGTVRSYINGQETLVCGGFSARPSNIPAPTDMWIGKSGFLWDAYLTARLADFKIFGKVLVPGEIPTSVMPARSPLLLWYKFDEPSSATIIQDYSGNGFNGVIKSDTSGTALPKLAGNFLSLDGAQKQFVDITNMNAVWGSLTDWSITASINFATPAIWARIFDFGHKPRTTDLYKNGNLGPASGWIAASTHGTSTAVDIGITVAPGADTIAVKNCWMTARPPSVVIPANTWVALTWTYEAALGTVRAYINGQESMVCGGFISTPFSMLDPTDMWLGKSGFLWDSYLSARIDDFKIFGKTLKPGEIPTRPVTPPMLLWYKFDEPSSSTQIQDYSGNGFTGLLKSDVSATSLATLNGKFITLNGAQKQYLDITNMNNAWGALNDWSVTMQINFAPPTIWARIFDFGNQPRSTDAYFKNGNLGPAGGYVMVSTHGTSAAVDAGISVAPMVDASATRNCWMTARAPNNFIVANTWATLTWTYQASTSTVRAYIDGQQSMVCSGTFTTRPSKMPAPTDMWIGKSGFIWDAYLTARLSDFKIFNRTLTPAEIAGPLVWYQFNDAAGSVTVRDYSGNGYTGMLKSDLATPALSSLSGTTLGLSGAGQQYVVIDDRFKAVWADLSDWSVAMCIKINNAASWSRLFDFVDRPRANNGAPGGSYIVGSFLNVGSNTITPVLSFNDRCTGTAVSGAVGTWSSFVYTYDSAAKRAKIFVNKQLVANCLNIVFEPLSTSSPTDMFIGKSGWAHDPYITADFKSFRVFGRTLSDGEASDIVCA